MVKASFHRWYNRCNENVDEGDTMKRMKKVDIIARAEQLEDLKEALNRIGIQGMTVSQVFGCGLQKGIQKFIVGKSMRSILYQW